MLAFLWDLLDPALYISSYSKTFPNAVSGKNTVACLDVPVSACHRVAGRAEWKMYLRRKRAWQAPPSVAGLPGLGGLLLLFFSPLLLRWTDLQTWAACGPCTYPRRARRRRRRLVALLGTWHPYTLPGGSAPGVPPTAGCHRFWCSAGCGGGMLTFCGYAVFRGCANIPLFSGVASLCRWLAARAGSTSLRSSPTLRARIVDTRCVGDAHFALLRRFDAALAADCRACNALRERRALATFG